MKLISIEKVYEGCMLPKSWLAIVSRFGHKYNKVFGLAFYIPWIFTGPYYDPMRRLKRFGWRIPKVLFEIRLIGRFYITKRSYEPFFKRIVIESPKLQFHKYFWYEPI